MQFTLSYCFSIFFLKSSNLLPLQGTRDGTVVRALASHQCSPGSIPARSHMWVEFVVGSRLALRVFSCVLRFPPSQKPTSANVNSTRLEDLHGNQLWLILSKYCNLFIILFISFNC